MINTPSHNYLPAAAGIIRHKMPGIFVRLFIYIISCKNFRPVKYIAIKNQSGTAINFDAGVWASGILPTSA